MIRTRRFFVLVMILALGILGLAPAANAVTGNVYGVLPSAEIDVTGQRSALMVGADVQVGQTIVTGASGQVELLFSDGTKIVVGPSSSLLLQDFLFRGDGGTGSLAVNMLGGTFRFMTGTMSKRSYKIDTPTGTIGVRGTVLEISVNYAGNALIALLEGKIDICAANATECQLLSIDTSEVCAASLLAVSEVGFERLDKAAFIAAFPYLFSQTPLDQPFQVDNASECFDQIINAATTAIPEPHSSSPSW